MDDDSDSDYEVPACEVEIKEEVDSEDNEKVAKTKGSSEVPEEKSLVRSLRKRRRYTKVSREKKSDGVPTLKILLKDDPELQNIVKFFVCDSCKFQCTFKEDLDKHEKSVCRHLSASYMVKNDKGFYICDECEFRTIQKKSIVRHIHRTHLNLIPYRCTTCSFKGKEKKDLITHVYTVHLKIRPFKCSECSLGFGRKGDLVKHIRSIHLQLKPYKCAFCDYICSEKGPMKKHTNAVHLKLKPHKCPECDFHCSNRSGLSEHVRSVHKDEKEFLCEVCSKGFKRKVNCNAHVNSVHKKLKPFTCEFCDYRCTRKSFLTKHSKVHGDLINEGLPIPPLSPDTEEVSTRQYSGAFLEAVSHMQLLDQTNQGFIG